MCALTVEAAPWSVSTVDVGPEATFRGLIWISISITFFFLGTSADTTSLLLASEEAADRTRVDGYFAILGMSVSSMCAGSPAKQSSDKVPAGRSYPVQVSSRGEDDARPNEGQRLGGPWGFPVTRAIRHRENDPAVLSGNDIVRLRWSLGSRCSKKKCSLHVNTFR